MPYKRKHIQNNRRGKATISTTKKSTPQNPINTTQNWSWDTAQIHKIKKRDTTIIVYKRHASASRYYQYRYFEKGRYIQKSTRTDNLKKALEIAEDEYDRLRLGIKSLKRQTHSGQKRGTKLSTLSEHFYKEVIMSEVKTETRRSSHARTYGVRLKHLRESKSLGSLHMGNIQTSNIRKYIEERKNDVPIHNNLVHPQTSNKTISHELTALRRLLSYAEEKGVIASDAIPKFPTMKVDPTPRLAFTPKQVKQIFQEQTRRIKECDKDNNLNPFHKYCMEQLYDAMLFLYHTGMRPGELYTIEYKNILWDKLVDNGNEEDVGQLRLTTHKTNKSRPAVQFEYGAVRALSRLLKRPYRGKQNDNRPNGSVPDAKNLRKSDWKLFPNNVGDGFTRLLRSLDLKEEIVNGKKQVYSLYSFRHSYIVRKLNAGAPEWLVAKQCGTSSTQIHSHYSSTMAPEIYGKDLLKVEHLTEERLKREKKKRQKEEIGEKDLTLLNDLKTNYEKLKKKYGDKIVLDE